MTTMNVSLPESLKAFVDAQVSSGGYRSTSEYVCELVRAEQKRQAREELELKLLEALKEPGEKVTPAYWEELRQEAHERAAAHRASTRSSRERRV